MAILSIITVVKNGERYIKNCIENVIDQKCKDIEHIIIDGGSSDKTIEIIKQYAKSSDHIRYISENDSGQSAAMNKGIKLSKGKVIGFLNVDDLYNFGTLPRILDIFKSLPNPSFIVGICAVLDQNMKLLRYNYPHKTSLYHLLSRKYEFPQNPAAYFYHKSFHEKVGYYDEINHNNYSMDLDFILRLARYTKFHFFKETWGIFVLHPESKTYQELADESIFTRVDKIFLRHFKKLTIFGKILVQFIIHIGFPLRIKYYHNKK